MSKREAFTLVELTVTMSAGSAMMILAIGLLHQSMSLATVARQRADHQRHPIDLPASFVATCIARCGVRSMRKTGSN